jgi:hypothetical protein
MTPLSKDLDFVTWAKDLSKSSQAITSAMGSQKENDSIDREGLRGRLIADISSLRTRGLGRPKAADRSDLLKIAVLYAPGEPTDEDRVEALVETAITQKYGGKLFAHVSRLAFGADLSVRGADHKVRYRAAWKAYGTGTYSSFTTSMLPKIGQDLASQITKIFDEGEEQGWEVVTYEPPIEPEVEPGHVTAETPNPVTDADSDEDIDATGPLIVEPRPIPQTDDQAPGSSVDRSAPARRPRRRIVVGAILSILLVAAAVLVVSLPAGGSGKSPSGTGGDSGKMIPPRGTIINATTGEVDHHPDLKPLTRGEVRLVGGGPIFRACDVSQEHHCVAGSGPIRVEIGDRIRFIFVLQNEGRTPLPYGRFSVRFKNGFKHNPYAARAEFFISWPGVRDEAKHDTTKKEPIGFLSKGEPIFIRYAPGSTELIPGNSPRRLTYLPDGITSFYGVGLTHIGPTPQCFINCYGRFVRLVTFVGEVIP